MSDFHVLTQSDNQKAVNVVFHIQIPAVETNEAGIQWQEAIVMEASGAENINSVLYDITPEEEAALKNGSIVEKQVLVRFSSVDLTNAQRLQEVKNRFNSLKSELITEKQIKLAFMGYSGNVV